MFMPQPQTAISATQDDSFQIHPEQNPSFIFSPSFFLISLLIYQTPIEQTTLVMMFTSSILLISTANASVTAGVTLTGQATRDVNISDTVQGNTNTYFARTPLTKRAYGDCAHKGDAALDAIIKASAEHYTDIAHARLDNLMREFATAKVTSGTEDLPKEEALFTTSAQTNIDNAKTTCTSEELVPAIRSAIAADANLDVAWSKQ
jgi:hypothetical protein